MKTRNTWNTDTRDGGEEDVWRRNTGRLKEQRC